MTWQFALVLYCMLCLSIPPLYALWIFCGWINDRYDQWRWRNR